MADAKKPEVASASAAAPATTSSTVAVTPAQQAESHQDTQPPQRSADEPLHVADEVSLY